MKLWEEFYPDVAPEVMGCPDPTMDVALRRSAQRFIEQTEVWRQWLDDVTTTGDFEHDLELELNTELGRLMRATLAGQEIRVYAPDDLPANWRTGSSCLAVGVCTFDRKVVQLVPKQSAGMTLSLEAALKPSNKSVGIPDHLFDQYAMQIALGAKALLMIQPEKAWTNPQMGGGYATAYQGEIDRIASEQWHGSSSAPRRVRASFL